MSELAIKKPKTIVYVDGFNLYYRSLKETPYKWLNLDMLFHRALPHNEVVAIKYYTSRVSSLIDPKSPARQQAYVNALSTINNLEIFWGSFVSDKSFSALAKKDGNPEFRPTANTCNIAPEPEMVKVHLYKEKKSDVNLASHLIRDAAKGEFDAYVLVTSDSDFTEPIKISRYDFGATVGLIPTAPKVAKSLTDNASFVRRLHDSDLKSSQFPEVLTVSGREIKKPCTW